MEKRQAFELSELIRLYGVAGDICKVDRDNRIGLDALIILLWLKGAGSASPKRISFELNFNPSKTTRCIERLLRYSLVEENLNVADLRESILSIAPKGWKVISELERSVAGDLIDDMLDFSVRFRRAIAQHNECYEECKLTEGRARVLSVLYLSENPMTISDLCACAKLKQPSVSMMVDWLAGKNLVLNDAGSVDGRTRSIRLSDSGETAACALMGML
ncbi:MAG: hypothetical protein HGA54_08355 [Actinobacteria bacterium]|nr:hypothetical protein [Actinomycetota bacterium]